MRIKLNAMWCNLCQRNTGVEGGKCVVCGMVHEVGKKWERCEQCSFNGYIAPSGNQGYICPNCGSKIESVEKNPRYFYGIGG